MSAPGEFWMRWRVRLGYPVALVFAWLAEPTPAFLLAGMVIAAGGLLIRAAAAGHLRKHEELATSGIYARTRNPLYFGSVILAMGLVVAGRSMVAAAVVGLYLAVFYPAVMRREGEELRARYGPAFEDYAARVPLFWMRLSAAHPSTKEFSWQAYRRNREWQAALGTLVGLGLLWAKWLWWR